MENLNKQQIVLLTLLVSFVTSIATGIVTVSLVDQSASGVPNTVNRVIERTIQTVSQSGDTNQAAVIASGIGSGSVDTQSQAMSALAVVEKSVVTIKQASGVGGDGSPVGSTTGIGVVVSKRGLVVTNKAAVALYGNFIAQLPDGSTVPMSVIQSQDKGDLVFLSPLPSPAVASSPTFVPATLATTLPSLGQTVFSLSVSAATTSPTLIQGFVTNDQVKNDEASTATFMTNLSPPSSGTEIVFDTAGKVLGVQTVSGTLYPARIIKDAIPQQ